jgi:hypothetical protein
LVAEGDAERDAAGGGEPGPQQGRLPTTTPDRGGEDSRRTHQAQVRPDRDQYREQPARPDRDKHRAVGDDHHRVGGHSLAGRLGQRQRESDPDCGGKCRDNAVPAHPVSPIDDHTLHPGDGLGSAPPCQTPPSELFHDGREEILHPVRVLRRRPVPLPRHRLPLSCPYRSNARQRCGRHDGQRGDESPPRPTPGGAVDAKHDGDPVHRHGHDDRSCDDSGPA